MKARFHPILFDLDATLVDSGRDIAQSVNRTLKVLGRPTLAEDEIIGFVGDGVRRLIERTLQTTDRQQVDPVIALFRKDYRQHCLVHTRPYPGALSLLKHLPKESVGVVTNKPTAFAKEILDGLTLSPHIGTLVGGDETDRIKPHPDPILLACQRLNVLPIGGIMIGDHQNDVMSGRASQMTTCGVTWGFDHGQGVRAANPDHLCDSFQDLGRLLLD